MPPSWFGKSAFRAFSAVLAGGSLLATPATSFGKTGRNQKAPTRPAEPTAAPSAPPSSPAAPAAGANAATGRAEFVDALPTSRPAAPDLLLSKGAEQKAAALADFAEAILAEDNSDADAALAHYRKALELDPGNAQLAVKAGFMLVQRDDPSTAILILKDCIKAAPKEALPLVYLSQVYLKNLKKPDLALKYAEQAMALDANYFPAYGAAFEALMARNQGAKAEQTLERATHATSTDPTFWLSLGEILEHAHFREDGTWDSPTAAKQTNAIFTKASTLAQDSAAALAKIGQYYVETKQVKQAIPFYLRAVSLKKDVDETVLASARENLARALLNTGDRDEAITVLEEIAKANSLSVATFELLGDLYEQKGDLEKSLANFQQASVLNSSAPQYALRAADLQMRLKHFDEAVETAKNVRARFPDNPESHYVLAVALGLAKRHEEALTAFAEAQSEFETDGHEDYLNAPFYFQYGAAAEQAGMLDKAEELLRKSIELDPKDAAQAYNYIGYMWADRGEHLDEAEELIKKAVDQDPENGAYLDSLGWLYFKKGDVDKAVKELQQAEEKTIPEDATVDDHLADAFQKAGNIPEALHYWQKALALHQDELDAKKVADKIEAAKQKLTSKDKE